MLQPIMKLNDVVKSGALAFLLIIACHLMIRFGGLTLSHYGTLGFMPGSFVEIALSGNPYQGFGDWRTIVVVNVSSWLLYTVVIYIILKLFSRN